MRSGWMIGRPRAISRAASAGPIRRFHQPLVTHRHTSKPSADRSKILIYDIIFVDSITAVSRLSFRWAEQQPEAFNERTGKKDTRGAYGLLAREMLLWLYQLQHARGRHVVFVGILEKLTDEFNATSWQPQMEGARTGRELPGIVDQIITMQWIDFGDGAPTRAFVCTSPNAWGYPAKDRAGRLEQIEEPHLGKLIVKLVGPGQRKPFIVSPKQTLKAAK
jgi:AAA domain